MNKFQFNSKAAAISMALETQMYELETLLSESVTEDQKKSLESALKALKNAYNEIGCIM